MRILVVNTNEGGGAGIACRRMAEGLRACGVEVDLMHSAIVRPQCPLRRWRKWRFDQRGRNWRQRHPGEFGLFSLEGALDDAPLLKVLPNYDLVHLHWVAWFVDWKRFFRRRDPRQPLFWTFHDQAPMSGGRHYEHDEARLFSPPNDPEEQRVWETKARHAPRDRNVDILGPSHWISTLAQRHPFWKNHRVHTLANGVDLDVFAPGDCAPAREALGLPTEGLCLLFVADKLDDPRKGADLLNDALGRLPSGNWFSASLGTNPPEQVRPNHFHLGHLDGDAALATAYRAADLLVLPSRLDNLPNTGVEACACGTPVVAFNVGGLHDIVEDGINGRLVSEVSPAALAGALQQLLAHPESLSTMGQAARTHAEQCFDLKVQADRLHGLYADSLERVSA